MSASCVSSVRFKHESDPASSTFRSALCSSVGQHKPRQANWEEGKKFRLNFQNVSALTFSFPRRDRLFSVGVVGTRLRTNILQHEKRPD